MTPAIDQLKKLGIAYSLHEYTHDTGAASYGLEAATKLGVDADIVFKTLVVETHANTLAVALLPVGHQLNLKRMAKAIGAKKVAMANPTAVSRSSGYVLGGVSPLGQKRPLPTVIDESALSHNSMYVSGGHRGLEIELAAQDLATATNATFAGLT
ncbi:MAG: Cys-tRNA(Pro) deacylase [Oceanospirillaceae bacterium]|nr:Cys-tRNA(Pro) deacylase [Oceanospirillaceae bacterium]